MVEEILGCGHSQETRKKQNLQAKRCLRDESPQVLHNLILLKSCLCFSSPFPLASTNSSLFQAHLPQKHLPISILSIFPNGCKTYHHIFYLTVRSLVLFSSCFKYAEPVFLKEIEFLRYGGFQLSLLIVFSIMLETQWAVKLQSLNQNNVKIFCLQYFSVIFNQCTPVMLGMSLGRALTCSFSPTVLACIETGQKKMISSQKIFSTHPDQLDHLLLIQRIVHNSSASLGQWE